MSDIFNRIINNIDRGMGGYNTGLPMGVPAYDEFLTGLQPKTYYLVGGETSTGKTAFVDSLFVINPLLKMFEFKMNPEKYKGKYHINEEVDLLIYYYTFEIGIEEKVSKWILIFLWKKYGIILDYNTLISRGVKNRLSQEIYDKVVEANVFVDQIMQHITFVEIPTNPTGISKSLVDHCKKVGVQKETITNIKGFESKSYTYTPNNPNLIQLCVIDHIALMKSEQGFSKKENIDKMSEYAIGLRNRYGMSFVFVSQFNRDLADVNRQRFKELQPQLNDFKNTGNMAEDCEIAIALFNPMRYNILNYQGYDIKKYGRRSRFSFVLKNRYGIDNVGVSLNFLGEGGYFRKMATPKQLETDEKISEMMINFNRNIK